MKIKKAVIPAAGLGKRFYPLTRAQPKEMLPIVDKPVIHYVVEEAVKSGIEEILIIVGKGKDSIINYFDKSDLDNGLEKEFGLDKFPNIYFVRQKEQKGLADAVYYSKGFVGDEPFVVLLGDTIYRTNTTKTVTKQILDIYEEKAAPIIAVEKVSQEKIKDYGIIDGKQINKHIWKITDLIEKPNPKYAPSNIGITGIYALEPNIFEYIKKIKPGVNGEYQLTDALKLLCKDKPIFGYIFNGKRYDIGTKEMWIKSFLEFSKDAGYL
ncbi:MAG: UTP--glucose-1-phosphate uridylyltransferase [Candidatus Micrarchaeaceae archaeon]